MIKDIDNFDIEHIAKYANSKGEELDKELEDMINEDPELRDLMKESPKKGKKKIINEDDLGCSYPDCICQGNEITDCQNRTPKQRQTMSKAQTLINQVVLGYKTALVEGMDNLNKHTHIEKKCEIF